MAAIPVNQAAVIGANVTYYSILVGGDTVLNDGKTMLLVKNTGSSCTITVTPQKLIGGLTITPVSKAVTSAIDVEIGPFDPSIFNTSAGAIELTYSGGYTTTTIAPVSL
jgi:hypothetical protein